MSFDGAGTYSLVAGLEANLANGQPNDGTEVYAAFADVATALSTAICKDGQTTITANLPMSTFKLTGLGAGSANGDSIRYEQLFTTGTVTLLGALTVPGTVTPQGLLDVSGASAGQIKFPASQNASSNANTLDDYEEGTWTPTVSFGGGEVGVTYGSRQGLYTKIGDRIFISANITLSSKGSSTGVARVGGVPVTVYGSLSATVRLNTLASGGISGAATAVLVDGTGTFLLQALGTTATALADITDAMFTNTTEVIVSGHFKV